MYHPMNYAPDRPVSDGQQRKALQLRRIVGTLLGFVCLALLIAKPSRLLSVADLAAYAVCHRISSHSLAIGGRQLPLCARCSGTFLGALTGFLGQAVVLRRSRAAEFPPPAIIVTLVCFILLMGFDGANSYLTLLPGDLSLYAPRNWLRLTTGALNGLAMSALIYPVFNFTLWRHPGAKRNIRDLQDLGALLLMEACLVGVMLTRWSFLLYPLALLSAVGVVTLLTAINGMLVTMVLRRENSINTWREAATPLLVGITLSIIQIGTIDFVRYTLTGTFVGVPSLR